MQTFLFDWGDTLMVDYPQQTGKMRDWSKVTEINGACDALKFLSLRHKIYMATGATNCSVQDIRCALDRVNLSQYISGCFCPSNLGVGKDNLRYFDLIVEKLGVPAISVTMVGDSYSRDIQPALSSGLQAIWYNPENAPAPQNIQSIGRLSELCT